jgi:hypothetical protein
MRNMRIAAALMEERLVAVPAKRVALMQNHKVPNKCDHTLIVSEWRCATERMDFR